MAPPRGDVLEALDDDRGRRIRARAAEGPQPFLQLAAGDLGDALGLVEVADLPAPHAREHGELGVGIDGHRMADGGEQTGIETAVAVEPALAQIGIVAFRPGKDCGALLGAYQPNAVELAGVRVAVDGPARRHDVVEAHPIGQRLDGGLVGRGRQHQGAARGAVIPKEPGQEGLNLIHQLVGDLLGDRRDVIHPPARLDAGLRAGGAHRESRFPEQLVGRLEEALTREVAPHQTRLLEVALNDGGRRTAQHGSVKVEDRGGDGHLSTVGRDHASCQLLT